MKPQSTEATIFPPQRYATEAVDREIPLAVQLFLWQCIDRLGRNYHEIQELSAISHPNHAEGVYIIRNLLRYIINAEHCISSSRRQDARWRVMRYKGGSPPLMIYAALLAAMICQACGLDKQKENFW